MSSSPVLRPIHNRGALPNNAAKDRLGADNSTVMTAAIEEAFRARVDELQPCHKVAVTKALLPDKAAVLQYLNINLGRIPWDRAVLPILKEYELPATDYLHIKKDPTNNGKFYAAMITFDLEGFPQTVKVFGGVFATEDELRAMNMLDSHYPMTLVQVVTRSEKIESEHSGNAADSIINALEPVTGVSRDTLDNGKNKFSLTLDRARYVCLVGLHCRPLRHFLPQVFVFYSDRQVYYRVDYNFYPLPSYFQEIIQYIFSRVDVELSPYKFVLSHLRNKQSLTIENAFKIATEVPLCVRIFFLAFYRSVSQAFGFVNPNNWNSVSRVEVSRAIAAADTVAAAMDNASGILTGLINSRVDLFGHLRTAMEVAKWTANPNTGNPVADGIISEAGKMARDAAAARTKASAQSQVVQATSGRSAPSKGGPCHNCGKLGHKVNACPSKGSKATGHIRARAGGDGGRPQKKKPE